MILIQAVRAQRGVAELRALPAGILWLSCLGRRQSWSLPLLGWIYFQTKALLTLLILEKLRGHQRKGVSVKG